MKLVRIATRAVVGAQLLLGLAIWFADAYAVAPLHIALGLALVGLLWSAAFLARATAPAGLVALAVGWGALLPAFGLNQTRLLPGDWHWVVRLLHLAVGVASVGIVESLARAREASRPAPAPVRTA